MTLKASSDLGHSPPSACSLLQVKLKRGLAPRPKLSQRGGTDRGAAAGSAGAEERLGDLESGQLGSGSHLCLAAAAVWRRTVWRDLPAAASGERREDETRGEKSPEDPPRRSPLLRRARQELGLSGPASSVRGAPEDPSVTWELPANCFVNTGLVFCQPDGKVI